MTSLITVQPTEANPKSSSPAFDASASATLDTIENQMNALAGALRLLWQPARAGGPLALVVAAGVRAMAEMGRTRQAIEEEAGLR